MTLLTMMVAALPLMADYLVDPDVLTIKTAQFTLRNLLCSQLGRDALAQLDGITQGYLQVSCWIELSHPYTRLIGQSWINCQKQSTASSASAMLAGLCYLKRCAVLD